MYIKQIEIDNFQSFYGKHSIQLKKGVNIFCGSNDAGKSKLFNVFNWVFFNRIYGRDQNGEKKWHNNLDNYGSKVCNFYSLKLAEQNDVVEMKVDVKFESKIPRNNSSEKHHLPDKAYNTTVEYFLSRKISFKLIRESEEWSKNESWQAQGQNPEVELYFKYLGEMYLIESPQEELDLIFPLEVRDYMWFQGEGIDKLVDFESSNKLRSAINKISYFPVYEKLSELMSDSLVKIEAQLLKKKSKNQKNSKQYEQLVKNIELENKRISEINKNKKEAEDHISTEQDKINNIKSKLRTLNEYPDYYQKEIEAKNKLKLAQENFKNVDEERTRKIKEKWMMKGFSSIKNDFNKIVEDYKEKIISQSPTQNPLPDLIPGQAWIDKMLEDCMCYVCERKFDIDHDKKVHKALLRRSSNHEVEKNEEQKQLNFFYKNIVEVYDELLDKDQLIDKEIDKFNERVNEKWDHVYSANNKYKEIKTVIKEKFGADSIVNESKKANELIDKVELIEEKVVRDNLKLQRYIRDLNDCQSRIKEFKNQISKIESPSKVILKEEQLIKYYQLLDQSLKTIKLEAFNNLLENIEIKSNHLYSAYLKHRNINGGYLAIDKTSLELKNFTDDGSIRDSNESNEDIAKISVINSILKLNAEKSGVQYPFITDAPSSSFDMETTLSYTSILPELFEQCIIMSKDFNIEDLNQLKESDGINAVFKLEYKPVMNNLENIQENSTTIITAI